MSIKDGFPIKMNKGLMPREMKIQKDHRMHCPSAWIHFSFLSILILLAACTGSPEVKPTSTPTPIVIARQIATLGPTKTPDAVEIQETQAARTVPTAIPTVITSTPTPYVGVFLGEAAIGEINAPFVDLTQQPTATRDPFADRFVCAIDPGEGFGTNWIENSNALNGLRCPIQESFGFSGFVQLFEGGAIYWQPDTNEFWAIAPSSLTGSGSFWKIDQPPEIPLPLINAPEGTFLPQGPIKDAWLSESALRAKLGFAILEQQEIDVNVQRFQGGTLFLDATVGQVFALLVDGSAIGPIDR